jgi:hypothetical protein
MATPPVPPPSTPLALVHSSSIASSAMHTSSLQPPLDAAVIPLDTTPITLAPYAENVSTYGSSKFNVYFTLVNFWTLLKDTNFLILQPSFPFINISYNVISRP